LLIDTEDRLFQFSQARPTPQTFLLVRLWNRNELGLPDFADDEAMEAWTSRLSTPSSEPFSLELGRSKQYEPVELESHSRALRLIAHLGQPFSALLLAQQRGGEYKRIASDYNITAEVKDMTAVHDLMGVRTLEIL
jgi:hypothetical protein